MSGARTSGARWRIGLILIAFVSAPSCRDADSPAALSASSFDAEDASAPAASPRALPIRLVISHPDDARGRAPITVGVPLPASELPIEALSVADPSGPVPTQVREIARLGRKRWVRVDFQARPGVSYTLQRGARPEPPQQVVLGKSSEGLLSVDTGAGVWTLSGTSDLIDSARAADGTPRIDGADWGVPAKPTSVEVVETGPLRAMVRVRAEQAVHGLDLVARLHFYAGLPYARVRFTLVNHQPARLRREEPNADNGDCDRTRPQVGQPVANGLLSPGRIELEDLSWRVHLSRPAGGEEILYQDSSGTDYWDRYQGREPRLQAYARRRGYLRERDGVEIASGDVAEGVLVAGGVRFDVPWFRELFPKALRARGGDLEFGILPGEFSSVHRLRAGEQKTHDLWIGLDPASPPPGAHYAAPSLGSAMLSEELGLVGSRRPGAFAPYENYVDDQLRDGAATGRECQVRSPEGECARSILDARELWDYYGWMDFGDVPTDFERAESPYNLKYDLNLGFLLQALRTSDRRWWELAHAANLHFADIDIFHSRVRGYERARDWWEGGSYGHSHHDEWGFTNPHRNCGNPNPDLYGGAAGLATWALLSGDDVAREAALELADNTLWIMANSRTSACVVRAWGGGDGTGFGFDGVAARAVAMSVRIAVRAWGLTGDPAYLEAAGRAADWVLCEEPGLDCASWPVALLARALGEYAVAARGAGLEPHPDTEDALEHLLEGLSRNLVRDGDRAWFGPCPREPAEQVNAWMLLAADAFALGTVVTGDPRWLEDARASFETGQRDPFFEGDHSQYHSSKEVANVVPNGLIFLHVVGEIDRATGAH